jgi:hypothetical protein
VFNRQHHENQSPPIHRFYYSAHFVKHFDDFISDGLDIFIWSCTREDSTCKRACCVALLGYVGAYEYCRKTCSVEDTKVLMNIGTFRGVPRPLQPSEGRRTRRSNNIDGLITERYSWKEGRICRVCVVPIALWLVFLSLSLSLMRSVHYRVTHPPTCYLTISDKHPSCDCTKGLSPISIHPNCLPCLLFHLFHLFHLSPVT